MQAQFAIGCLGYETVRCKLATVYSSVRMLLTTRTVILLFHRSTQSRRRALEQVRRPNKTSASPSWQKVLLTNPYTSEKIGSAVRNGHDKKVVVRYTLHFLDLPRRITWAEMNLSIPTNVQTTWHKWGTQSDAARRTAGAIRSAERKKTDKILPISCKIDHSAGIPRCAYRLPLCTGPSTKPRLSSRSSSKNATQACLG